MVSIFRRRGTLARIFLLSSLSNHVGGGAWDFVVNLLKIYCPSPGTEYARWSQKCKVSLIEFANQFYRVTLNSREDCCSSTSHRSAKNYAYLMAVVIKLHCRFMNWSVRQNDSIHSPVSMMFSSCANLNEGPLQVTTKCLQHRKLPGETETWSSPSVSFSDLHWGMYSHNVLVNSRYMPPWPPKMAA